MMHDSFHSVCMLLLTSPPIFAPHMWTLDRLYSQYVSIYYSNKNRDRLKFGSGFGFCHAAGWNIRPNLMPTGRSPSETFVSVCHAHVPASVSHEMHSTVSLALSQQTGTDWRLTSSTHRHQLRRSAALLTAVHCRWLSPGVCLLPWLMISEPTDSAMRTPDHCTLMLQSERRKRWKAFVLSVQHSLVELWLLTFDHW